MPKVKPVPTLSSHAVERITQLLSDAVKRCASEKCKKEKDKSKENSHHKYDSEVQSIAELGRLLTCHSHVSLHDSLFLSTIKHVNSVYMRTKESRQVLQEVMAVFLNNCLLEMDFGKVRMFSEANMCKVLFDHLDKCSNIERLIIGRSCYWRAGIFEELSTKLSHLSSLSILRIQYICTPAMIKGIGASCPKLLELDLKGSEKLSDSEVKDIAACKELMKLDISGTRITGKGCWGILDNVKSLEWLQHCAFNCNSDSLIFESRGEMFDYINNRLGKGDAYTSVVDHPDMMLSDISFNLKNFWLFNPQTEEMYISFLCPHLEQLRLDFVFQDLKEEPDMEVITRHKNLNHLIVSMYDHCAMHLNEQLLEACGTNLTTLELHLVDDWFIVAEIHNIIAKNCPSLIKLHLSGDYKGKHSLEDCDEKLDFTIPAAAHPHLKHLAITGVVSNQRLRHALMHTPNLETLYLDGELEWLHDTTFMTALCYNPLTHLEVLWFNVSTTVTLDTVKFLVLQKNKLRRIGRLCHMNGSTMEEYQDLLRQVRHLNYDVQLIWVTDQREKL